MAKSSFFFYSFCLLILVFQCKQKNRLAQNESSLISELSTLENLPEAPTKKEEPNKYLGVPEESRADPSRSPIVLDIIGARSNVRDIKFMDLYSKIRYIPIRFNEPIDSIWNRIDEFDFLITPNNIIASHFSYGISQFDLHGNFINQIVQNDFYYTSFPGKKAIMVSSEDLQQFVGAVGKTHAIGDKIFYQFHNAPESDGVVMQYDTSPKELGATMLDYPENSTNKPKGGELFDIRIGKTRGSASKLGANNIFPINENEWATSFSKFSSSKAGSFMVSTNLAGDTICKYIDHDPVRNYSGGAYRAIDQDGSQYSYRGIQHIRQGFNDTIYSMSNVNQLIPKYVLNFGKKGIRSPMEGMDSRFDLKDKYVINDIIETNKNLFILYTQDAPSPNSAKKGNLFYNACIFDKEKEELFHVYLDKFPYIPPGSSWPQHPVQFLENDYDNGPAFWPNRTTSDGNPFMWFRGLDLKQRFNIESWNNEELSLENMKDDDYVLMIAQ